MRATRPAGLIPKADDLTLILVLKRQKTSGGESTAISIEWENEADEQFWLTVLDLLVRPAPMSSRP